VCETQFGDSKGWGAGLCDDEEDVKGGCFGAQRETCFEAMVVMIQVVSRSVCETQVGDSKEWGAGLCDAEEVVKGGCFGAQHGTC